MNYNSWSEADTPIVCELNNTSTREFVQSGYSVMIGGLIIDKTPSHAMGWHSADKRKSQLLA